MRLPVTISRKGRNSWQRFTRDEDGNIAVLLAFMLIPMMMTAALALDGLRAFNAATTTSSALDAAALAAARAMADGSLSDGEVKDVATRYFEANAQGDAKLAYSKYGSLDIATNRNTGEVTVAIETTVPTTLAKVVNFDEFTFRRTSTALAGVGEIELGLMLDVTGSMGRRGKLDALKRATEDLVNIIIPEGRYADRVRIGLAPYSTQVNMGAYASRVREKGGAGTCLVERANGSLNTDAAPGGRNLFRVLTESEKVKFKKVRDERPACPNAEVLPLTSDKSELLRTVDGYSANGYTAGHLGIQWAWNLISPKWSGVWPGASRPKGYGAKDLIKAVVLMTDGEFNSAFTGKIADQAMKRESFGHADDLCRNMKAKDVVVFSVAFDLRNRNAREALEKCATNEDFFYRAENEKDLREAYRDIAIKLTQLRLSK